MQEAGPREVIPAQTPDGKPIVYISTGEAGVYIYCPQFGINLAIPKPCYNNDSVRHSLETLIGSKSDGLKSPIQHAASPLVFIEECRSPVDNGH